MPASVVDKALPYVVVGMKYLAMSVLSIENGILERARDHRDEILMTVKLALETTLARATVPSLDMVMPRQTVEDVMMMGLPWT
jgi:hypothetical protein